MNDATKTNHSAAGRSRRWLAYGLAVGSTFATLGLRLAMDAMLGGRLTSVIFTLPIMLSAYVGGLGPGLLATALSYLAASYYLLPPFHSFAVTSIAERWQQFFVVLAGILISGLNEALHRSRRRTAEVDELFSKAFRLSPDCVVITRMADRIVIRANDALCRLWDSTPEEVVGQPAPAYTNWLREDERLAFMQALNDRGERLDCETTLRMADGRLLEFNISSWMITFNGESCILTVMRDITERKRTEAAVRESEARLRVAVESAELGTWDLDLITDIAVRSPRHDEIWGYQEPQPEWGLEIALRHMPPEDRPIATAAHARAVETGVLAFEARVRWPDGSIHWIAPHGRVSYNREGRPVRIIGVVADITERKQAEEARRESEARYRTLFEYAPDGIVIADPKGSYVDANASACRMLGYPRAELIRLHSSDVVSPEEIAHIEPALSALKATPDYHREWQLKRKDGSIFPAEVIGTAMPDGNILAMIRDIAERKAAGEALDAERALLRTLIDLLPDYIYVKDAEGRFLASNAACARLMGAATPADLTGKTDADFYPGALTAEFGADERAVLAGTPLVDKEEPSTGHDGIRKFILTTKLPLKDRSGVITGLVGYGRNVTAAKEAEAKIRQLNADLEQRVVERTAQLEAANKELEAFSYSVSHDLRAPLRAVDGFAQAVLEDFGPQLPAEGRRQLQTIRNSAQRMGALIDDLLRFSQLSRQTLQKRPVETGALVRATLAEMPLAREGRQVEITIGELPACEGDPALLKQVWVNLLSNALKYSGKREHAVVEIGCVPLPGEQAFFVRDNGTGFDLQYAGKLFGVFQRLHRAKDFEGTGVGLAIVQRIVHRHGGRIWADAAVDRGATFYFTLRGATPHE